MYLLRLSAVVALATALASCTKSVTQDIVPDEYVVDCEGLDADAGADNFASDENYASFVNAEAAGRVMAVACMSPQLVAPSGSLSAQIPPTITFQPTPTVCRRGASPAAATRVACRVRRSEPSILARLGDLVEGTAEAHCGAFTGENYILRLTAAGETKPVYMAVLSVTSYTPDAAIWQHALSGRGGQTLGLTIERAVFFRGDISEGPYIQPTPYPFPVAP